MFSTNEIVLKLVFFFFQSWLDLWVLRSNYICRSKHPIGEMGMVGTPLITTGERQKQADLYEVEASLVCIVPGQQP